MTVTNTIRDEVIYDDNLGEWSEVPLSNEEIEKKLISEKNKGFLAFSTGIFVTAYARVNLLRRVIASNNDEFCAYCDTDSAKLLPGYDKSVFDEYNKSVKEKLERVSKILKIPFERFEPTDVHGNKHLLGVFTYEGRYNEFVTNGAKKYCYTKWKKNEKIKKDDNVIERGEKESLVLEITVSGVPKCGAKALKSIEDFKDDLVFDHDVTGKNLVIYVDNVPEFLCSDYLGNEDLVTDKSGCCIIPTTYVLGKSYEYATLIDSSSKRAKYIEYE